MGKAYAADLGWARKIKPEQLRISALVLVIAPVLVLALLPTLA